MPTPPARCTSGTRAARSSATSCRASSPLGHDVSREYYFNDFGAQVLNLGLSVLARRDGTALPKDGYRGGYVDELAAELPAEVAAAAAERPDEAARIVGDWATERVRGGIEASMERLGVHFDVWKQSALHEEAGSNGPLPGCETAGTSTRPTAPPGFGRPPSATTRIGSSFARMASPRTSHPTSATSPRSSTAASTS